MPRPFPDDARDRADKEAIVIGVGQLAAARAGVTAARSSATVAARQRTRQNTRNPEALRWTIDAAQSPRDNNTDDLEQPQRMHAGARSSHHSARP